MALRAVLLFVGLGLAGALAVSPVQKVIELLEDTKGKIVKDLAAEEKEMTEYSAFCDEEQETKGYAIKDATALIAKLEANIQDAAAIVAEKNDEIALLGTAMAEKDQEIAKITATREAEKANFASTEKELMTSIDELERAYGEVKKGMPESFMQVVGGHKAKRPSKSALRAITQAISSVVDAAWVQHTDKNNLKSFLQQAREGEDFSLRGGAQQRAGSGGLLETLEEMKEKAEGSLSDARKEETEKEHSFAMMSQSLDNALKVATEKKGDAAGIKETSATEKGEAEAELAEAKKSKSADEAYVASLKVECEETAAAWAERQAEAKEEMGAVDKAKEILSSGVKVFVQFGAKTTSQAHAAQKRGDFDDEDSATTLRRSNLVNKLKEMARRYHSFALMEMASTAAADPFEKIRGLIGDMISKLMKEAEEEATQKGFCDEEMGKSKASHEEKSLELEKLTSRLDKATTTKTELELAIKELEAEIGEIDSAQAEATKIRGEENAAYKISSKDFKDSAEATEKAIIVLKEYYEGALLQVSEKKAPSFGSAKGDAGSSIISILEMAAEDFTKTYTEIESSEEEAAKSYEKLTQENKVAKTAKEAEAKAKASEVKSLTVAIENAKTDSDMVSKELGAVEEYLEKLKPQCETKVMSYEEKKAKREAEVEGLKEALSILEGSSI